MIKYELIIRCASFNLWPENKYFGLKLDHPPASSNLHGEEVAISYEVRSYNNDKSINVEKKTATSSPAGPALWTGHITAGRQLGTNSLVAAGEYVQGKITATKPSEGEIDAVIRCEARTVFDEAEISRILSPLAYQFAAFLRLHFDPHLSIAYPPQLVVYGSDGTMKLRPKTNWIVAPRYRVDGTSITPAIAMFASTIDKLDLNGAFRLESAARRSFTLQAEIDFVDRYCDAWEICESLAGNVSARRDVVGKIATALATHMNANKKAVENRLGLREIYRVRKDLVHHGLDNPFGLEKNLPIIENVAVELLRYKFSLQYQKNNVLDTLMASSGGHS